MILFSADMSSASSQRKDFWMSSITIFSVPASILTHLGTPVIPQVYYVTLYYTYRYMYHITKQQDHCGGTCIIHRSTQVSKILYSNLKYKKSQKIYEKMLGFFGLFCLFLSDVWASKNILVKQLWPSSTALRLHGLTLSYGLESGVCDRDVQMFIEYFKMRNHATLYV